MRISKVPLRDVLNVVVLGTWPVTAPMLQNSERATYAPNLATMVVIVQINSVGNAKDQGINPEIVLI